MAAKETKQETMTIAEYLASFSPNRKTDKVFVQWFRKIDAKNPKKTKTEWDFTYQNFLK